LNFYESAKFMGNSWSLGTMHFPQIVLCVKNTDSLDNFLFKTIFTQLFLNMISKNRNHSNVKIPVSGSRSQRPTLPTDFTQNILCEFSFEKKKTKKKGKKSFYFFFLELFSSLSSLGGAIFLFLVIDDTFFFAPNP